MRKVKKINGYLVVRFNERERRDYPQLGAYGVIDAELYTGNLDVDRGEMEYEDAETLEAAMEQARGLEGELDVEEPEAVVTVTVATEDGTTRLEITPEELIQKERHFLETHGTPRRMSESMCRPSLRRANTRLTLPKCTRECISKAARCWPPWPEERRRRGSGTWTRPCGAPRLCGPPTVWGWHWSGTARTMTAGSTAISFV